MVQSKVQADIVGEVHLHNEGFYDGQVLAATMYASYDLDISPTIQQHGAERFFFQKAHDLLHVATANPPTSLGEHALNIPFYGVYFPVNGEKPIRPGAPESLAIENQRIAASEQRLIGVLESQQRARELFVIDKDNNIYHKDSLALQWIDHHVPSEEELRVSAKQFFARSLETVQHLVSRLWDLHGGRAPSNEEIAALWVNPVTLDIKLPAKVNR